MGKFSFCLPPFAPDYSGVCSALFTLGGLTVIHDAAGCTGNYVNFDEPRWYGSDAMVYCSGLRNLDAVLGNDDMLIDNVVRAAKEMNPVVIALVGSPVPTVIGTDMEGIAFQVEEETRIPSFGFPTTGMELYPKGEDLVFRALTDRFSEPYKRNESHELTMINILGDTPLDFWGTDFMKSFRTFLNKEGISVNSSLWDGAGLTDVRTICRADINVAVSYSGYLAAAHLEGKWGMPYIYGFPAGKASEKPWLQSAMAVASSQRSAVWGNESRMSTGEDGILILSDQGIANSLRAELYYAEGKCALSGLPMGGAETGLGTKDRLLKEESQIAEWINDPSVQTVIADPLYRGLAASPSKIRFYSLPHYAVSSKIGWDRNVSPSGR